MTTYSLVNMPTSARYCAFDLDECTVTIAFDSEHEVKDFLDEIPPGRRVHVCAEPPEEVKSEPLNIERAVDAVMTVMEDQTVPLHLRSVQPT